MPDGQLGILLSAAIDSVNAKAKLNAQIKQLQIDALKVGVQLDTASAKQVIKQVEAQMQQSVNHEAAQARQLQAQKDAFNKKNLSGIDAEIQKRQQASRQFSNQIKSQMHQALQAEKAVAAAQKQALVKDSLGIGVQKAQQQLLGLKNSYSSFAKDPGLQSAWQKLFDETKIVKSQKELTNLNSKIGMMKTGMQQSGEASNNLFKSFVVNLPQMLATLAAMKAVQATLKSFKDAVAFVKELDSALTTISLTMNLTKSQLAGLGEQAMQMSKDLGASATQVLKAAQIYANMNESVESILAKAKPTVMLSTASGLDTSNTADIIQGIMQQFNMAEAEAMKIVDVIESLSANIAVDYQKGISTISEAIQTSGSVAEEAGLSYEKFAAIVSATAEKTRQSGSVLGNAYKTIFSRISRSNTDDASIEEISKAEKAFESVGVSVRNAQGQFRDIGSTLDDLAAKWGSLDTVQRSYIAEQAAGIRQKNVFLATMNSYNKALELEKEAMNSEGFANETNDKYMQSFKAHVEEMKTSFNEFWTNFVNSDVIIFLVDIGTAFANVLNGVTKLTGALPLLIAGITSIITLRNSFMNKMNGNLNNMFGGNLKTDRFTGKNMPTYAEAA